MSTHLVPFGRYYPFKVQSAENKPWAARAAIPAPAPLSAGCTTYFDYYVKARTDIKAFAWNREGHCTSVTAARRTLDEAMRECTKAWKECSLYAVGQALAPG
jgi:hypothetical protein